MATFVGIVGSRKRSSLGDRKIVCQIVDTCVKKYGEIVIVSGGAKGPDSFAEDAAKIFSIPTVI